jgi:hypothetical protein
VIELRYSAPDELDISGSVSELQDVRRAVLKVAKSGARVEIDADRLVDPDPYKSVLSKLIVTTDTRPTKVSVTNEAIFVAGAPNCLEALASFLDFKTNASKGDHSHYEYYEGNNWIAPDSVPLVISVR